MLNDLLKQFIVVETTKTIQTSKATAIKFSIWREREKNTTIKAFLRFSSLPPKFYLYWTRPNNIFALLGTAGIFPFFCFFSQTTAVLF